MDLPTRMRIIYNLKHFHVILFKSVDPVYQFLISLTKIVVEPKASALHALFYYHRNSSFVLL